jgi:hypothetical protein
VESRHTLLAYRVHLCKFFLCGSNSRIIKIGIGLVRGGAGTALVGDPETVAARIQEYADLGIDTFMLNLAEQV